MQKSGIVMTVNDQFAVVFTKDGQFCHVPFSPGMEVGRQVQWLADSPEVRQPAQRRGGRSFRQWDAWRRYGTAGLAASLLVAVGAWVSSSTFLPVKAEAYAYVSVDINPSVSLTVDKKLQVLSAVGANADGKTLVGLVDLQGQSLSAAMAQVVTVAISQHMMPLRDSILVTAAPVRAADSVSQIETQAEHDLQDAIQTNPAARSLQPSVFSLGLSHAVWEAADEAKIPPGKLAVYLVARDKGEPVHLTQVSSNALNKWFAGPTISAVQTLGSQNVGVIEQLISQLKQNGLLGNYLHESDQGEKDTGGLSTSQWSNHTKVLLTAKSSDKKDGAHSENGGGTDGRPGLTGKSKTTDGQGDSGGGRGGDSTEASSSKGFGSLGNVIKQVPTNRVPLPDGAGEQKNSHSSNGSSTGGSSDGTGGNAPSSSGDGTHTGQGSDGNDPVKNAISGWTNQVGDPGGDR